MSEVRLATRRLGGEASELSRTRDGDHNAHSEVRGFGRAPTGFDMVELHARKSPPRISGKRQLWRMNFLLTSEDQFASRSHTSERVLVKGS